MTTKMQRVEPSTRRGDGHPLAKWSAETAFRPVVEATADKAGLELIRHLVKDLSKTLGVDYAFVAEFAGAVDRVRTVAFWSKEHWINNFEYNLAGTPCERVVNGETRLYKDNIQGLFPQDSELAALGARSYLGVPLRGAHGQPLGHLAALDSRPMSDDPRSLAIIHVFANRARIEIERLHADAISKSAFEDLDVRFESASLDQTNTRQNLELAYDELDALLEINQSSMRHLNRTDLFAELARSVKPLLRCERFGIEEPTGPESLRVHVLALDRSASGPMIEEFPSAGTVCRWAQEQRCQYVANSREVLRKTFPMTYAVMEREKMESLCALPLIRENRSFGALFFMSTSRNAYENIPRQLLERVAGAVALAVDNCFAYEELAALRDKLATENKYLKEEIRQQHNFDELIGTSPAIDRVRTLVKKVAATHSTVLIHGETGTGKELIARAIHSMSPRSDRPLVKVNCAAISAGLVESELFGHVRGAFTGAVSSRAGRFEIADGGSIFLDEIGELPLETQVKILRVLQESEFEPVGSTKTRKVDVRIIAATNRNLEKDVESGHFRADLYYRLNVFPLQVPPLRERAGDIELLADFFLKRFARNMGKDMDALSQSTLDRMRAYTWPGNVRELSNVIERAIVLAPGRVLDLGPDLFRISDSELELTAQLPSTLDSSAADSADLTLKKVQRQHIVKTLEATRWVVEGPKGAASLLGLSPSTLRHRMQKLGIRRSPTAD